MKICVLKTTIPNGINEAQKNTAQNHWFGEFPSTAVIITSPGPLLPSVHTEVPRKNAELRFAMQGFCQARSRSSRRTKLAPFAQGAV